MPLSTPVILIRQSVDRNLFELGWGDYIKALAITPRLLHNVFVSLIALLADGILLRRRLPAGKGRQSRWHGYKSKQRHRGIQNKPVKHCVAKFLQEYLQDDYFNKALLLKAALDNIMITQSS